MMNLNDNKSDKTRAFIYLAYLVLSICTFFYKRPLGLASLLVLVVLIIKDRQNLKAEEERVKGILESLNQDFDQITKQVVFSMPFSIAVLDDDRKIKWYNTNFKKSLRNEELAESLSGRDIGDVLDESILEDYVWDDETIQVQKIQLMGVYYRAYFQPVRVGEDEYRYLLYAVDDTEYQNLKSTYENESLTVGIFVLDNYDDWYQSTPSGYRTLAVAEIDQAITLYVQKRKGFMIKLESDKYLAIFNRETMEEFKEDHFHILDNVKEEIGQADIPPTLSIGIGTGGKNALENYEIALAASDIALGRGGDQAVVRDGEKLEYFGGKKPAKEKSSKVKARVVAHALQRLLNQSKEVFCMGHKNPDMDSYASCMGVWQAAKNLGKTCYTVLEEVTPAINNIYRETTENIEGLKEVIISPERAMELCNSQSLVVIVDNHRKHSSEEPGLLNMTDQIVLIDHHRRGEDFVTNTTLTYLEPSASSASELITELLDYMFEDINMNKYVADALLAGITVDTKNFTFQTGIRTFEAATILKRQGANSIDVRSLFKDDYKILRYKSEVIANAQVFMDRFMIGRFDHDEEGGVLIASQAADSLLTINGIEASFVLTRSNGLIHISGRSLGGISVQLILEKLGGGGHQAQAATQMDSTMDEAEEKLKEAIREYTEEENQ